jgi:hypothetical protein
MDEILLQYYKRSIEEMGRELEARDALFAQAVSGQYPKRIRFCGDVERHGDLDSQALDIGRAIQKHWRMR